MTRRLRLALLGLAGVLAAGLVALLVTVYLLLQPDRFTAMLRQQAQAAGLELSLASPASPTLFPRPALELQGLTLTGQGASMPILLAASGRLALPWRTLFGGPTVISRLEIDAPRVDLDALQAWLSSMPPRPANAPPNIPRIDTGVRIARGTLVRGNQLLLRDFSLDAGSLLSGRAFPLMVSAKDAEGTPMQLRLTATPRIQGNALQLNDIDLDFTHGATLSMRLTGEAHWHGAADASATLAGSLEHADAGRYEMSLRLTPANQNDPLLLALKLDGPGDHIDLRLPPLGIAQWWTHMHDEHGPQLAAPPGNGSLDATTLDLGGVRVEGLQLELTPSPAASSPAPADSASR
ncbi:MAG TPA: AsmA family protein [Frateuria sp.]|uniref:AsmA family protein n=1 Tax=Frateuria sp. TaxID=2211372 RepID=UPI002DE49B54|nr:AsmA family protein [Frateuria sp.]